MHSPTQIAVGDYLALGSYVYQVLSSYIDRYVLQCCDSYSAPGIVTQAQISAMCGKACHPQYRVGQTVITRNGFIFKISLIKPHSTGLLYDGVRENLIISQWCK